MLFFPSYSSDLMCRYTQPDVFLVSGESLVRNLLLGIGMAKKFGKPSLVGYLPDSFGMTCGGMTFIHSFLNCKVIARKFHKYTKDLASMRRSLVVGIE
jgi:alpha-mannosidase